MDSEIVKTWFGNEFENLAPELQQLHLHGGVLQGQVQIVFGRGIAGIVGRRLAKKVGIPNLPESSLVVTISHEQQSLHWDRQFDGTVDMKSVFKPIKTIADGYWIEETGPVKMVLTVDIKNQGWHWRCLRFYYYGIRIPVWIFPESQAYKYMEDGGYKFYVGFKAPFLGHLLSYSGILQKDIASAST